MKREQVLPHVMADMAARIAKGADEYGEPLTTFNGRDALQDSYEEALDLAVYLKQALMERASATYPVVVLGKEKLEALGASALGAVFEGHAVAKAMSAAMRDAMSDGCGVLRVNDAGSADHVTQTEFRAPDWPGPDWSQAPEWADGWVKCRKYEDGMWFAGQFGPVGSPSAAGWDFIAPHTGKERWADAPSFGYTGDWRDSLRKRPK
jgi:hypothetical protein